MRHTSIAVAKPFEGAPKINLPSVYGASPKKPIFNCNNMICDMSA